MEMSFLPFASWRRRTLKMYHGLNFQFQKCTIGKRKYLTINLHNGKVETEKCGNSIVFPFKHFSRIALRLRPWGFYELSAHMWTTKAHRFLLCLPNNLSEENFLLEFDFLFFWGDDDKGYRGEATAETWTTQSVESSHLISRRQTWIRNW